MHEHSLSAVASASTTFAVTDIGKFDWNFKAYIDEDVADDSAYLFM